MNKIIEGLYGKLEVNEEGKIRFDEYTYCYKSSKDFKDLEDNEIAYVSETYLDEFDEDTFYTKEEIIKKCPECTKSGIVELISSLLKDEGKYIDDSFVNYLAEDIYSNAEWACVETSYDELDIDEVVGEYIYQSLDFNYDKVGYFCDDVCETMKNCTAEEVVEAMEKGEKPFFKDKDELYVYSDYDDFTITKDGQYLVVWDDECKFIDVYKKVFV